MLLHYAVDRKFSQMSVSVTKERFWRLKSPKLRDKLFRVIDCAVFADFSAKELYLSERERKWLLRENGHRRKSPRTTSVKRTSSPFFTVSSTSELHAIG